MCSGSGARQLRTWDTSWKAQQQRERSCWWPPPTRSYEEQQLSHERLMSVFGADADGMSATPGHSQHQLGTAVDFTNAAAGYNLGVPFAQTSAHRWLEHHAREYGFVLAYPRGKEEQTGYRWEPWHYRYVGVEDAKRLEESNLSLQEFLERAGTTPNC